MSSTAWIPAAASVLCALHTWEAGAATLPVRRHPSGITTRKRLHVNTLIAQPGTVEVDWAALHSYTTGAFSGPAALKFSPEGRSLLWGRTEYSAAFDSVHGDRLTLAATVVVFDGTSIDVAVAPQVIALLRDDSGARLGSMVFARFDGTAGSGGIIAGWTAATSASDTNPAGTWDLGAGFGRPLLRVLTPHANCLIEKSTGLPRTISWIGGLEVQMTERFAVDVSGQRTGVPGGPADVQLAVGLTANFGRRTR